MNNENRSKIKEHIPYLVKETCNFSALLREIRAAGVFNEILSVNFPINIQEPNLESQVENFYHTICTRGPEAFSILLKCLYDTGNNVVADFLSSKDGFLFLDKDSVIKAKQRLDQNSEECYKMSSSPRGYALIINIDSYLYNCHERRDGSETDIRNLTFLLEGLGYDITVERNLTGDQFRKKIKEFSQLEEHKNVDSTIVIIMSHGTEKEYLHTQYKYTAFVAHDNVQIDSVQDVVQKFYVDACPNLAGKPKIFIFQACRGEKKELGIKVPTDISVFRSEDPKDEINENNNIPNGVYETRVFGKSSDCLIVYSTHPGCVSLRDPILGAWLIQDLCSVFALYSHNTELIAMIRKIMQRMEKRDSYKGMQLIHYENLHFHKKLYFNPGLK